MLVDRGGGGGGPAQADFKLGDRIHPKSVRAVHKLPAGILELIGSAPVASDVGDHDPSMLPGRQVSHARADAALSAQDSRQERPANDENPASEHHA